MLTSNRSQQKLFRLLGEGYSVWVLYLDIVKFHEVEFRYGIKVCKLILEELENEIARTLKQQRNLLTFALSESRGGDDFVIYFVPNSSTPWQINEMVKNWVQPLEDRFNTTIKKQIEEKVRIRAGIVKCDRKEDRNPDYLLYAAVKEAFLLSKSEPDPLYFSRREEVTRLLNSDSFLKSAFQPIINLRSGLVFGFEALARIIGSTSFQNIGDLFPFAEKIGQLYPIETLCRRKAITSSRNVLEPGEALFLNINPQVLTDPEFSSGKTKELLYAQGLEPSNVVLEITERNSIDDFTTFREALTHYRSQGYRIALDDVGAGYSSLQSIAELHPDFLKIDRSLISGVNADPIKWAMLETFVTFSKRIGCQLIAEGVETEEELRTVIQLGADYVQGFFMAKPDFTRLALNEPAIRLIETQQRVYNQEQFDIVDLTDPLPLFDEDTKVKLIDEFFHNHPNELLVGIVRSNRITGVVQREKLYMALGTRYGIPLYLERSVNLVMDKNPLIVEDTTPIEVVSHLAMERPHAKQYDGIIVVKRQMPLGLVNVSALLRAMAARQIKSSQGI